MIATRAEESQVCAIRRFVAAHVSRWGLTDQDRDSAVLIIGELAGNAALHGGPHLTVSVSLDDRDLCIDVIDSGPSERVPLVHVDDAEDEHGRGLVIVDHLASWTEIGAEQNGWRSRAGLRVALAVHASAEAPAIAPSPRAPLTERRSHVDEALPAVNGSDRASRPKAAAPAPYDKRGDNDAPVAMTRSGPRRESMNSIVSLARLPGGHHVQHGHHTGRHPGSRRPGRDRLVDVRRGSRGGGRIRTCPSA
ncbi:ATP-binding protein [Streptomyces sp. NPDC002659]|uniref:ATP-binding protein n=1 Tax=Streptomyces sp. NPDC002659 TaxID=3364656 RepID=UPI0036CB6A0F